MKLEEAYEILEKEDALYIPHGSDETYIVDSKLNARMVFISHTVQMKLRSTHLICLGRTRIYIPHGSDETRILMM